MVHPQTKLLKKYGGPDPELIHTFKTHWPNILPVVKKLIRNDSPISVAEWQNLFHDIHMICSWDSKGCYKLLDALERELRDSHLVITKSRLARIPDAQQKLKEYIDCWSDYNRLCEKIPTAFQQLDLAAKDILPQTPLLANTSDSPPNSPLGKKLGAVRSLMIGLWDNHIARPFVKQLQDDQIYANQSSNAQSIQTPESRFADLIANYCDFILRRNTFSRKLSPSDITDRLVGVLTILNLAQDKDSFLRSYRHHLVRRLILDSTIDLKFEEEFIGYLKEIQDMPNEPIYKFARMIKDIKTSENIQSQFRKSQEHIENINNNNSLNINDNNNGAVNNNNESGSLIDSNYTINVKVLNPSAWTKADEKLNIFMDEKFNSLTKGYELFYCDLYESRKLNWCNQISNGIVAFNTSKGKFDLEVNAAQLSILSAFNNQPQANFTLDSLARASGLNTAELRRTIWSLVSNPKLDSQIVICDPKPMSLKDLDNETNCYRINHDFALT